MTTYIFIILSAVCWVHMTGIMPKVKAAYKRKRMKPFDCELCLAFWVSLGYALYDHNRIFDAVLIAFTCAFAANMIYLIMKRWDLI